MRRRTRRPRSRSDECSAARAPRSPGAGVPAPGRPRRRIRSRARAVSGTPPRPTRAVRRPEPCTVADLGDPVRRASSPIAEPAPNSRTALGPSSCSTSTRRRPLWTRNKRSASSPCRITSSPAHTSTGRSWCSSSKSVSGSAPERSGTCARSSSAEPVHCRTLMGLVASRSALPPRCHGARRPLRGGPRACITLSWTPGLSSSTCRKSACVSMKQRSGVVARTVAVRFDVLRSAISPTKSPPRRVASFVPPFVTSASPSTMTKNSRPTLLRGRARFPRRP